MRAQGDPQCGRIVFSAFDHDRRCRSCRYCDLRVVSVTLGVVHEVIGLHSLSNNHNWLDYLSLSLAAKR